MVPGRDTTVSSFSTLIFRPGIALQVRNRRGLQVCPQERVEWQELILMGVLTLQQQLCGAPQRQGDAGGGQPPAEKAGRPAGLRQQLAVLL